MRLVHRKLELKEFNDLFVVEYSITQNNVSVKSVNDMLHANRRAISKGLTSDYLPVAFFTSREEAVEMSNKLTDSISEMITAQSKFDSDRKRLFDDSEDKLWTHFRFEDSSKEDN